MTIKNKDKTVSAENEQIIKDVIFNDQTMELIITKKNLYTNASADTTVIDFNQFRPRLAKVDSTELARLASSSAQADIDRRETHLFLVPLNDAASVTNADEFEVYIWISETEKQGFEKIGTTRVDLAPLESAINTIKSSDILDIQTSNGQTTSIRLDAIEDNKQDKQFTASNTASKNVVTDSNGFIVTEDKPTIPQAGIGLPQADTSTGSAGGSNTTTYSKSDHVHPKSTIYAEASHTHDYATDITNKPSIPLAGNVNPQPDAATASPGNSNTTAYAKIDHVHPKSTIYAESGHNHDSRYIQKSNTTGLVKNDGSIDTNTYIHTSNTTGLVKNDGTIDTGTYLQTSDVTGSVTSGNTAPVSSGGVYNALQNYTPSAFGPNIGNFGDLQDIIDAATAGDIISLDKDYKNSGSESAISISKNLTIIGNGHILDADGESAIISVTGGTINFIGLSFINGLNTSTASGAGGGAISSSSTSSIKINSCNFINNSAPRGGAIRTDRSCTIIDSTFYNNNSSLGSGGAIYCETSNLISDSIFVNNRVTASSSHGGAIYCIMSNIIFNCIFDRNQTTTYGGAIYMDVSKNTITNCNFTNNSAANGGAIGTINSLSQNNIVINCSFTSNTATSGKDIWGSSQNMIVQNCNTDSANLYGVVNKPYLTDHQSIPTIPTDTSDLTNGAGFITQSDVDLSSVESRISALEDELEDLEEDLVGSGE